MSLPEHVEKNRAAWSGFAKDFFEPGRKNWATTDINWGIYSIPESELMALGDLAWFRDKDVVELGCGTAYFSAWFAKLGARPVGIDITPAQLESARQFQSEFGIEFPLIEGSAEDTGLPSGSFDVAFSEYGASIWCDPFRWIPEASRLLRPGGKLIFLRNATLAIACMPNEGTVATSLQRSYESLKRINWADDDSVEFQLPHGEMIRLLRSTGFEVENLLEIIAPEGTQPASYEYMTLDWASRWPFEEIWVATKK